MACFSLACAAAASSAQQSYAQRSTQIRIGQLILIADPVDRTPNLLINLSADSNVLPAYWSFANPNHPAGATKSQPAYWEVTIDSLTDTQAANYDVLVISAHSYVDLNPTERARLQKFMDSGGILWIDLSSNSVIGTSGGTDLYNGFPLAFKPGSGASPAFADYLHPVLSSPNAISYTDLVSMTGPNPATAGIAPLYPSDFSIPQLAEEIPGESQQLQAIMGGYGNEEIAVGQVGDGYEVVTCNDITDTINSATSGAYTAAVDSAIKLAANIFALGSQAGQEGAGGHKTGSNNASIQAPLLQSWNDSTSGTAGYTPNGKYGYSPASTFHGFVAISQNNGTSSQLLIYTARPSTGMAGQGTGDYALAGYAGTQPYELIKSISLTGPISPPTCFEVPVPTGSGTNVPTDEVWVQDGTGNLDGYYLDTGNSLGVPVVAPGPDNSAAPDTSVDQPGPYAPTFQDGLLFVADNPRTPPVGRIWIVDPVTSPVTGAGLESQNSPTGSNDPWQIEGDSVSALTLLPEVSGPATAGYIPIGDGSGGLDRVVYVPTLPLTGASPQGAALHSYWLGVKNELVPPSSITVGGGTLQIVTRASQKSANVFVPGSGDSAAILAMGPKLTIVDESTGLPWTQSQMQSAFTDGEPVESQAGILVYNFSGTLPASYEIRIDYSLDWGTGNVAGATPNISRGYVAFPDNTSTPIHRILDHIVLGPTGILYLVTSAQDASGQDDNANGGGDFWELQEYSPGLFNVLVRWSLYDEHTVTVNGSENTVLPAVSNQDPLVQLNPLWGSSSPYYAGQMQYLTFTSGPVLSGDSVYCMAQGFTNRNLPDTALFAFRAHPGPPTLRLSEYNANSTFSQPDITASVSKSTPEIAQSVSGTGQYLTAEQDTNSNWRIEFTSLSNATSGPLAECLSLSQPIDYNPGSTPGGGGGAADQFIYPDTVAGDRWSPLSWYTVFTGAGLSQTDVQNECVGPPFVSSNTVYVPAINQWGAGAIPVIFGINSAIAANDGYLVPDQHPWQSQLTFLQAPSGSSLSLGNMVINPDLVWPHLSDVTSFSLFQQRVNQAALTGDSAIYGLTGGSGNLFAWTNRALYGFEQPDYVVADSGRVADFDAVGDPIWSTDQTLSTENNDQNTVGNVHPLVQPVRAYPLGNGQTFVVDAGGNRVAVLDNSGHETRTIEGFQVDPGLTPDGYFSGETTKFSSPRDIIAYTTIEPMASIKFTNPAPTTDEYWVHYIIADSGNRRLLDLVDRYQYNASLGMVGPPVVETNGSPALGILYWHSPSSLSGGQYSYTCVARGTNPSGGNAFLAAGIGDVAPALVSGSGLAGASATKGGIVVFPSGTVQPSAGGYTAPYLFDDISIPAVTTPVLYAEGSDEVNGTDNTNTSMATNRQMGPLNSLTSIYYGGQATLMFTDSSGVYELESATLGTGTWVMDWMLPRSLPVSPGVVAPVYSVMRQGAGDPTTANPLDFRPTYAERLASGNVIVVNGYTGRYRKAQPTDPNVNFKGEILEISGNTYSLTAQNLGFTGASILYQLPPVNGARELSTPVFATRR